MVKGCGVRAGCGHFHLQRRDECVVSGTGASLGFPPVLTQAAAQQEVLPGGFIITRKTQEGVFCRRHNSEMCSMK